MKFDMKKAIEILTLIALIAMIIYFGYLIYEHFAGKKTDEENKNRNNRYIDELARRNDIDEAYLLSAAKVTNSVVNLTPENSSQTQPPRQKPTAKKIALKKAAKTTA